MRTGHEFRLELRRLRPEVRSERKLGVRDLGLQDPNLTQATLDEGLLGEPWWGHGSGPQRQDGRDLPQVARRSQPQRFTFFRALAEPDVLTPYILTAASTRLMSSAPATPSPADIRRIKASDG